MRILVTGGNGFVGRNFVRKFLSLGYDVTNIDSMIPGGGGTHSENWLKKSSDNYSEFLIDCRTYFETHPTEKFDLVLHLAAVVGGRLTIEQNPLAVADDLSIDAEFWKWASISKPGHIICFSSSAAYPISLQNGEQEIYLKESDIDFSSNLGMPDLTYGWAKLTHEYLGRLASSKYDLNVTTYRPFSGYGADQSLNYPFPSIIQRAIDNKNSETMMVWGTGLQSRDFIHIDDVVEGVLHTYPMVKDGSAINLCNQRLTSFIELATMACAAVGYSPQIRGNSDFPEGVFSRGGDSTFLNSLGFIPKIKLEEGVRRTVEKYMGNSGTHE